MSQLRTRVENAISSLLPHGRALVGDVARSLAMSERTLGRKLADEGLNFTEILQQLRRDLAVRYLMIASCMYPRSPGCSVFAT
jgi:AraC-like DNA-binding protein